MNEAVGLRELRQNASELVRRAEAGEELLITVSGRPAAALVPVPSLQWRKGSEIADIFRPDVDAEAWRTDRETLRRALDDDPRDPWSVGEPRNAEQFRDARR